MVQAENCHHLLNSLSGYIDGELKEELCKVLEAHLAECQNCRIVVDTLRKTVYLYQVSASAADMPVEVKERLYKRLELSEFTEPARRELRAGDLCPVCLEKPLDYDGLLNLSCPRCGIASGGCFT